MAEPKTPGGLSPADIAAIAGAGKKKTSRTLSYRALRALWIQAGGAPELASTMAAVALAESSGRVDALNDNPRTGDYSVGPWQINYFGDMREGRTRAYGSPEKLRQDPLANARAAVAIYNSQGLGAWSTYSSGAYQAFLRAQTPAEKAADKAAQAAADVAQPGLVEATTDLSLAKSAYRAQAEATRHIDDPWITVKRNNKGFATGFGEATGETAPANVLTSGGVPVTKSMFNDLWESKYSLVFQEYTGRNPTPDEQADIIESGMSYYALRDQLSKRPTFRASPAWKQEANGLKARFREVTGLPPSDEFIRKALANRWDAATFDENARSTKQYTTGPVHKQKLADGKQVYQSIYGQPDEGGNLWIKSAVKNGWTPDQMAARLRDDPDYKYSAEAAANTYQMLETLGMFIGARPVITPAPEATPGAGQSLQAFRDRTKLAQRPAADAAPAAPVMATLPKPVKAK